MTDPQLLRRFHGCSAAVLSMSQTAPIRPLVERGLLRVRDGRIEMTDAGRALAGVDREGESET